METYDPNVASLIAPIQSVEEELARQAKPEKSTVPSGLIRHEKNVDTEQMAEFATSIDEIMPGPGGMIQDEVMGPPMPVQGNKKTSRKSDDGSDGKAPLGLTEEQFYAAIAGVAAVLAFSKPVQSRLSTMIPKFMSESGDHSPTGLIVTALVAAIAFYFARKFLAERM
jgi:hypothetical protein